MIEANTSYRSEQGEILLTIRKHWIAYLLPVAVLLSVLPSLLLGKSPLWQILSGILSLWGVLTIAKNAVYKWTVSREMVVMESRNLFWMKSYWELPVDTIYEAIYYRGPIGAMLGYGTVLIRRTEGITSEFRAKSMSHGIDFAGIVNNLVREQKAKRTKAAHPTASPHAPTKGSTTDELLKLLELKEKGGITPEEYEQMKKRLLND